MKMAFFFLFLIPVIGISQENFLILQKGFRHKKIFYSPGETISFRLKGDPYLVTDVITGLVDSTILFESYQVPLKEIDFIRTRHTSGWLSPSNGPKLIIAGLALFLIDNLNHILVQGNEPELHQGVTITSACLVGVGAIMMSFRYQKFRPGKNKKVYIL